MMGTAVADYVGIPYGFREAPGLDCYQLVTEVLAKVYSKRIPTYDYSGGWFDADVGFLEHRGDFKEVILPLPGDIVLLKIGRRPIHCGVVIGEKNMLHSLRGSNSCIERYDSVKWRNRIEGFYRWVS